MKDVKISGILNDGTPVKTDIKEPKDEEGNDKNGMEEYISEDEEEEEEDVDDEDEEIKLAVHGGNLSADMSLEEARYALQHIKNEATIDEANKKSSKPPYRYKQISF